LRGNPAPILFAFAATSQTIWHSTNITILSINTITFTL